nr:MAG TPA: hypothetical protein [Caudoviricetes sp.]
MTIFQSFLTEKLKMLTKKCLQRISFVLSSCCGRKSDQL